MKASIREFSATIGFTAALAALAYVLPAAAQPPPAGGTPIASETAGPTSTTANDRRERSDYGLFGLFGLLGLAGLVRRTPS